MIEPDDRLEGLAFAYANDRKLPFELRQFIMDLWKAYCLKDDTDHPRRSAIGDTRPAEHWSRQQVINRILVAITEYVTSNGKVFAVAAGQAADDILALLSPALGKATPSNGKLPVPQAERSWLPDDIWLSIPTYLHKSIQKRHAHSAELTHPRDAFQAGVRQWTISCFGQAIADDQLERTDRFVEEALELAQTFAKKGFTADRAHALVDYVFGRPVGERGQEVGGTMITLAALCNASGIDITEEAERELARIWTKVEAIRAKQAAKPTGSALPQ